MDRFVIKKPKLCTSSGQERNSENDKLLDNNPSTSNGQTSHPERPPIQRLGSSFEEGQDYPRKDIGMYVGKPVSSITNSEKEMLLRRTWEPSASHKCYVQVIGSKKRTFQVKWLQKYPWLAYSDKLQGAFCKYCVLFSPSEIGNGSHEVPSNLVSKPFNKWKDALEVFEKHSRTKYHANSQASGNLFLQIFDGKQPDVRAQISEATKQENERNRKIISVMAETILLCGRQEIGLRGHRDSGRLTLEEPVNNDGNFRALLRYRAKGGDLLLTDHINTGGGNAMYTSPTVQNELIGLIGEKIKSDIVERVNKAKFFTVLADETTDVSQVEQLSLCIRYFDIDVKDIREDFLTFVPVYDVTGAGLASVIKQELNRHGLELENLRGQGYDGAAAMSGTFNGVQALIREEYPKASYTHCFSHVLNLCLSYAARTDFIRNCFCTMSETTAFFRSSTKRTHILRKELESDGKANSVIRKYCDTRWVERHDAVSVFSESFLCVVRALEKIIATDRDQSSKTKATGLHSSLCCFSFITTLLTMSKFLSVTYTLSKFLQTESLDLSLAISKVEQVEELFMEMRKQAEEEYSTLFRKSEEISSYVGVSPTIPRRVGTQTFRSNVEASSPEDYYRRAVFIPYLDEITATLKTKFSSNKETLLGLECLLPQYAVKKDFCDIVKAIEFYESDLEHSNKDILEAEWRLWKLNCRISPENQSKTVIEVLKEIDRTSFPNIATLLTILAVIPVTTASVERSFSTLKRLKTYLRSKTGDERLTALALMAVHRDISVDIGEVVKHYGHSARRLSLS